MVDISVLFASLNAGRAIGEMVGVIESVGVKIDNLAASELKAGISALQQASRTATEGESLLREARGRLNKAVHIERGLRLAAAYVALATAHYQLRDNANGRLTLEEFLAHDFSNRIEREVARLAPHEEAPAVRVQAFRRAVGWFGLAGIAGYAWGRKIVREQARIEGLKEGVRRFLTQ